MLAADSAHAQPAPRTSPAERQIVTLIDADTPVLARDRAGARQTLMVSITIFVLAIFVGFELITKVPATLHTPLMSGSNAISGITVVGALIAAGAGFTHGSGIADSSPGMLWRVAQFLGFLAVILATINVAGGFLVTHRMLKMFRRG